MQITTFAAILGLSAMFPIPTEAQNGIGDVWALGEHDGWMNFLVIGSIIPAEQEPDQRFNIIRLPLVPETRDGEPAFGYLTQLIDCDANTITTTAETMVRLHRLPEPQSDLPPAATINGGRDAQIKAALCGGATPDTERLSEAAFIALAARPPT